MDGHQRFRDDGGDDGDHMQTDPMLHHPAPAGRRAKGTHWRLCLGLCCLISFFALSGVLLSPFFAEAPARPPPDGESSPDDPQSAGSASNDEPPTPAQQLDLKTGFQISSTPQTREYVFNITLGRDSPDGFAKSMILVNGQSPGPLIEANTGDIVRVVVHNNLPEESTTIHWHGIDQRNSNWMDGVTGVTQCGIPPGQSFTYAFNVSGQRGTFWYHSHASLQYTNGLYGPLILHDPEEQVPEVEDDKVFMFGDLFHKDAEEVRVRRPLP